MKSKTNQKLWLTYCNRLFLAIGLLVVYGSVNQYFGRVCGQYGYNTNSKYCQFANLLSSPSSLLLGSSIPVYKVLSQSFHTKKLNLSGLVAKKVEVTRERFKNKTQGFNFYYEPQGIANQGYLLLSRPDPDSDGLPDISIWDMNRQQQLYSYPLKHAEHKTRLKGKISNSRSLRYQHPLLLADGSIVVTAVGGPIIKIGRCGELITSNESFKFSHSLELGSDNRIYATMSYPLLDKNQNKTSSFDSLKGINFVDSGFAILDQNLNVLEHKSIYDIYEEEGMLNVVNAGGVFHDDPFHLNDVQPLDLPNGEKMVLLSIRHQSSILAYNLSQNKLVWILKNVTAKQHDVDIINKRDNSFDISIFNNNSRWSPERHDLSKGNEYVRVHDLPYFSDTGNATVISTKNDLLKHNVLRENFSSLTVKDRPITVSEGRADLSPDGNNIMIEETNFGRLFEFHLDSNSLLWEYINKSNNGLPFMLNWSRRLKFLDPSLKTLLKAKNACPTPNKSN